MFCQLQRSILLPQGAFDSEIIKVLHFYAQQRDRILSEVRSLQSDVDCVSQGGGALLSLVVYVSCRLLCWNLGLHRRGTHNQLSAVRANSSSCATICTSSISLGCGVIPSAQVRSLQADVDRVPHDVMGNEDLTPREQLQCIDAFMKRLQVTRLRAQKAPVGVIQNLPLITPGACAQICYRCTLAAAAAAHPQTNAERGCICDRRQS